MKIKNIKFIILIFFCIFVSRIIMGCGSNTKGPNSNQEFIIFSNILSSGFDIGVDSSSGYTDWLFDTGNGLKLSYPYGEEWGAVFIVAGFVTDQPRPSEDFSGFNTLCFEIKGEIGGETLYIGIKDKDDPDDGSETTIKVCNLTTEWQTVIIPLNKFTTADLENLYVVIELVFEGPNAQTVFFRNVKYLPDELPESGTCEENGGVPEDELPIYAGTTLSEGYDMGVNSSGGLTYWLYDLNGYMEMEYPDNQTWGAVFVTVGPPTDPPRPSQDLSDYKTLSVELKGEIGGETLYIGIKDKDDPDDGTETKVQITNLTSEWQYYEFLLSNFITADITKIYVVIEFVFSGPEAQTVYFRNVKYLVE